MKKNKQIIILTVLLTVAGIASATNWLEDRTDDVRWGNSANWSGVVPNLTNSAIVISSQATTYDIDVNINGETRLLQVGQEYTFNDDGGTLTITRSPAAHFENIMYNTTSGGTVTYNAEMTINTLTGFYGQMYNNNGGITVFNDVFTLSSGSLLNVKGGTHTFNGDLNVAGSMRLDAKVIIGGSGTTLISDNFISTSGAGSELYLNRTGAYTLSNTTTGYMRVEKTRIFFGAEQAVGTNTGVRMFGLGTVSALVSSGDYDQNFGWLDCDGPARFDMGNDAVVWTFADSSSESWDPTGDGELIISNVDTNNTIIRFEIDSGTGLTEEQIGQITLNGAVLTPADTTVDGGYLYITPATSIEGRPVGQPDIISSSIVSNMMKIVVNAPSAANRYMVEGSGYLIASWSSVAHSDDGINPFVVTNLEYASTEGSNAVIYVQTDDAAEFFQIVGE